MKLSTLECSVLGCGREFSADVAMWHLEDAAWDAGWRVIDGDVFCFEHAQENAEVGAKWVVGCWTCGFEEELSEEDARYEYQEHDCEPDTYLRSPAELAKKDEGIRAYRVKQAEEQGRARHQAELALARQHHIERYARNWLRIRNTFMFWKRESIHEVGSEESVTAREDGPEGRVG